MAIRKFSTSTVKSVSKSSKLWDQISPSVLVDFLVIAGGGSGGYDRGGGGGAGGYRCSVPGESSGGGTSAEIQLRFAVGSSYTISIGAGGATQTGYATYNDGTNSSLAGSGFATVTSMGGSASGAQGYAPRLGGSGGGCDSTQNSASSGGSGTTGHGYAGGSAGFSYHAAGGGGGAGAIGGTPGNSNGTSGNGGVGVASSITGTSITRAGGGGGGACMDFAAPRAGGSGGSGGGGAGGNTNGAAGTAGTANTGGGGGGGANVTQGNGAAGGSGVVILRALQAAASTTGSPTYTTSGSYHIYQFNGDGSITY